MAPVWTELAAVTTGFESRFGNLLHSRASDQIIVDPSDEEIVYIAKGYGGSPMMYRYDPSGGGGWDQIEDVAAVGNTSPMSITATCNSSTPAERCADQRQRRRTLLPCRSAEPAGRVGRTCTASVAGRARRHRIHQCHLGQHNSMLCSAVPRTTERRSRPVPGSRVWESFRGAMAATCRRPTRAVAIPTDTRPPSRQASTRTSHRFAHEFSDATTTVGGAVNSFPERRDSPVSIRFLCAQYRAELA